MIPSPSPRFTAALLRSHERHLRVTLLTWENGTLIPRGELGIVQANLSIDQDLASWRRLTGQFVLPSETAGALEGVNTFNGELSVEMGIGFSGGTIEWVQVAQLRIEETNRPAGKVGGTITAFDRAARVNDFPFITPYAPRDMDGSLLTVLAAIRDIITTAFPSNAPPTFIIDPSLDPTVMPPPETVFTGGRWDAVIKLAESIGAVVHNDNLGRFVIDQQNIIGLPVVDVTHGVDGTLVESTSSNTRVEQYNAVGLTCETPAGDAIFVYVVDNDPTSPTYYDGPFGRKPYMTRNDTIVSTAGAIASARSTLARLKSAAKDLRITMAYNPLLEPLDVIRVTEPREMADGLHVIDSITLPLTGGTMDLQTHLLTPATIERST